MQEFGGQAAQADGSVLAIAESEQDRDTLRRPLLQPMENRMEKYPLKLDAPVCQNSCEVPRSSFFWTIACTRAVGRKPTGEF